MPGRKLAKNSAKASLKTRKSSKGQSNLAVPQVSVYHQTVNHSFAESGGSVTYTSYDVITDTSNISRPSSASLQYCSSVPVSFIVYSGVSNDDNSVVPINWAWKLQTTTLLSSTTIRTLTLRFPRKEDYQNSACWRIVATGPLFIVGSVGFTAKNALETSPVSFNNTS